MRCGPPKTPGQDTPRASTQEPCLHDPPQRTRRATTRAEHASLQQNNGNGNRHAHQSPSCQCESASGQIAHGHYLQHRCCVDHHCPCNTHGTQHTHTHNVQAEYYGHGPDIMVRWTATYPVSTEWAGDATMTAWILGSESSCSSWIIPTFCERCVTGDASTRMANREPYQEQHADSPCAHQQ